MTDTTHSSLGEAHSRLPTTVSPFTSSAERDLTDGQTGRWLRRIAFPVIAGLSCLAWWSVVTLLF